MLNFPAAVRHSSHFFADELAPPALKITDIVEANTVQAHAGRQTSAVDNSTGTSLYVHLDIHAN
jgi:hypothetical protein